MITELVLGLVLLFLLWQIFKKPANFPPGRWGLPLIGYIPLTRKSMGQQLEDLYDKHGSIYLWRMGTQVMVFLHDYKTIRSAFSGPDFVDRPGWDFFKFLEEVALGVGSSNDLIWRNNRRFSLRQLRDLGMGKSKLVAAVQAQAQRLVEELKKDAGEPKPVSPALQVTIVNVIWQLVGGKHFEFTDPKLKEFQKMMKDMLALNLAFIPDFMPWVKYILPKPLLKRLCQVDYLEKMKDTFLEYFYREINEHRAVLDRENPRDLIDGYLIEMEDKKDDPENTCSDKDLALLILDLFFAGSETTMYSLVWMFYYLASYPEVQRKMQAEIDDVLPKGSLATLEDRSRLQYTEAVLQETLRMSSLANNTMHMAVKDTQLGGYTIPKGAVVNSASTTMHYDPRYWDRPEEFFPERWLDDEGKTTAKKEGFMPFGLGKRACLGESLARMELLIFSTAVFQSLSFSNPPGKEIDLNPEGSSFFFRNPIVQDVLITVRQ